MKFRAEWAFLFALAGSSSALAADDTNGRLVAAVYAPGVATPGVSAPDPKLLEAERSARRDPQTAVLLSILADNYRAQSRLQEAELLYWRSLSIFREKLGMKDPNVGTAEHKLGQLLYLRGSYALAVPHYQRALAVFERALGPAHANVTALMLELAGLYQTQGRLADAEAEYKRAIAILGKSAGADERSIELAHNGLAAVYQAQGRTVDAELAAVSSSRLGARTAPVVLRQRAR